jgi:hypothetical protein
LPSRWQPVIRRRPLFVEPDVFHAPAVEDATNDLTAYDLYLRGYAMYFTSAKQIPEVLRLMEEAVSRDSKYGPALAWAAMCCHRLIYDNRSENPESDLRKGADFARRALEVAGDDPGILVMRLLPWRTSARTLMR